MMDPVVVTGVGVITPIGSGKETFWTHLLEGRHGFRQVTSFDTSKFRVHRGAEVPDFRLGDYLPEAEEHRLGRATQFALAAAKLALEDAGLDAHEIDGERVGVCMGTTSGEPNQIERFNDAYTQEKLDRIGGEFIGMYPCHNIPARVAGEYNFTGVAPLMIPAACAAGNYAVAHSLDTLRRGRADIMLAGGSDAFSRITYTGFARLMAISPDVCRPFDKNRKGMLPGEGAGFLVLEPLSLARRRGAVIYAEIAGYGLSCDAHDMTGGHPEGRGAGRAMEKALAESGVALEEVSYISAHGTGTKSNDLNETISVKKVFGETAYRVPISSIKSMLGHTMGAASAIEAAMCALAIQRDRIPPTMHLEEPDPQCDLDYVPGEARDHVVRVAMNNAYAFGGTNASLILKKVEG